MVTRKPLPHAPWYVHVKMECVSLVVITASKNAVLAMLTCMCSSCQHSASGVMIACKSEGQCAQLWAAFTSFHYDH